MNLPSEKVQRNLLEIVSHFDGEDRFVRERQIRKCRRLKLNWDNIFNVWYSEVAHDWRVWDNSNQDDGDQAFYDKPFNILRAYSETIIAALSVTTPSAKCYPEDAESSLDTVTAKAGDKIGLLINRHNNTPLLWLHALYIWYTEGPVFFYSYPRADEKYGTYEVNKEEDIAEEKDMIKCPACGQMTEVDETQDTFQPEMQPETNCPSCGELVLMEETTQTFVTTKITGKTKHPKSRVCLEAYGGLYVKIANYAKKPEQTPYLIYSQEIHYATAIEEYDHLL
jgi:DNA-directed RNA polymerase subunit RPC12/RpoP